MGQCPWCCGQRWTAPPPDTTLLHMSIVSNALVRRIEAAEAASLAAIVERCGPQSWAWRIAGGIALFRTAGSPFTKLAGMGFAALSDAELSALELRYAEQRAPVQFELATYADPALSNRLAARGYRLSGYEEVLGHALGSALQPSAAAELEVRLAREHERQSWVHVLSAASTVPSEAGPTHSHDDFAHHAIEQAFQDMSSEPTLQRWLALRHGKVLGGAAMALRDGFAQLFGAATLPAARRGGVQGALLAARLQAAAKVGSELAVVTVQPGSLSHHNVQRAGFNALYARAIWRREHGS
jgi:hypothetical protein